MEPPIPTLNSCAHLQVYMFYIHSELDRAAHLRNDPTAISGLLKQATTRFIPVHQGRIVCAEHQELGSPLMMVLRSEHPWSTLSSTFLGLVGNTAHFALDCNTLSDNELQSICDQAISIETTEHQNCRFADLREIGPQLPFDHGSLLAYARALVYWQNNARYCTRCASALIPSQAGHVSTCSNQSCNLQVFPRLDPAVIMLVHDGHEDPLRQRCLLGRSPAWPDGVLSTLAGFVEPGESLEQAVAREVLEESNIRVAQVTYGASQPWPFPRSIMLGFHATALNTDIVCDPTELAHADWFTRAELKTFGNWGDDRFAQQLPRPDSIARYLIDQWIQQVPEAS
ncbi:MAG: NAD(+) diphosphatase [Gammaproteobacteria bacterium]|nr:NAD(+) diphosphatase [Gammaproteobacteria bacterium]